MRRCRVVYVSPLKALAVDVQNATSARRWSASGTPPTGWGCRGPTSASASARATPPPISGALRPPPRRHPHHHPRVALPAAHLAGARGAARRRDGDPRRGARRRRHQARRPPRPHPRTPRRAPGRARPAHRPVGDRASDRGGGPVPGRWPPGDDRAAAVEKQWDLTRSSSRSRTWRRWPAPEPAEDGAGAQRPSIWPHVEERIVDLIESPPLDAGVRQLASPGRTAHDPAQRDRQPAGHRRRPALPTDGMAPPPHSTGYGTTSYAADAPPRDRPGSPRLGVPRTARPDRGGPQGRSPARRRGDLEPRAGHRHGRGRPGRPGRVAPVGGRGLQRVGRAGHQVGAVRAGGCSSPSTGATCREAAWSSSACAPALIEPTPSRQPARRARPADRRDGALDEWSVDELFDLCAGPRRSRRSRAASWRRCSTCSPAATPAEEFAELRPARLGPAHRHPDGPPGRPAPRRHHGGTIPDRGLFGVFIARWPGPPGGRARRGDGLRVARGRRHHAGHLHLAHRGHHPRPGAGHPRPRPARPAAVLEGRHARASRRAGRRARRVRPGGPPRCPGRPGAAGGVRTRRTGRRQPARLPHRAAGGDRLAARPTARWWWSGSPTSSATGGS
jgi:hypothetical protein